MIHEIQFTGSSGYASWAPGLPDLAAAAPGGRLAFRPGLNVLFGRNGSGKTTVVHAIALHLAAAASGRSHAGEDWHRSVCRSRRLRGGEGVDATLAARVVHDGRPVLYGAAGIVPGVSDAGIRDEFFPQGLAGKLGSRGASSGERTLGACSHVLSALRGEAPFPDTIPSPFRERGVNDLWREMVDFCAARYLAPSGPAGQPTVLLDEPDAHWSLLAQAGLWRLLSEPAVAARFQVIVASHSPFALTVPHAHVIGLPASAVGDARRALRDLAVRLRDHPQES